MSEFRHSKFMQATKEQLATGFKVILIIAETIRDLKHVPSGILWTMMMDKTDLATYDKIINILKNQGLVREENHLLIWVEPAKI
jgi:hypothetical protein